MSVKALDAEFLQEYREIDILETLLNQSMSKLGEDDVLLANLHCIQDLPKDLLKMLARRLSAYGICLLESKSLLNSSSFNELWKVLYHRITSRFYEPLSRINSAHIDMKDLYFQRVFHDVLQCFFGDMAFRENLQRTFEASWLFSNSHETLISKNLERLKQLFKRNLTNIRIYPRILQNLKFTLSKSSLFQQALANLEGIELRDFKYISDQQLVLLREILNRRTIPNLMAIKFINCKFNTDVMEWFNGMIAEFCTVGEEERNDDDEIPMKKAKIDNDTEISFDEAICMGYNSLSKNNNVHGLNDCISEFQDIYEDEKVISDFAKVAFVNCHFDENATNELCKVVQKMPKLKSFTFFPEWKHNVKCADKILPSMLEQTHLQKLSSKMLKSPEVEEIMLEDCPLGFYSQKLLLWHQIGECTVQHGVFVPKPKKLKMADCNVDKFRSKCCCIEIQDFKDDLSNDEFDHTEKCDKTNVWFFDAAKTCSCNWLNLISIDLSENKLKVAGASALAKALECASFLQTIKLSFCSLDTQACNFIFSMTARKKTMKFLDVSNNLYDGREDSSLSSLIEYGTVTELILSSLFVPDGLPNEIVESFSKNSTIQKLDLSMNRLGDPVFLTLTDVLADSKALSALEVLDLSRNLIQPQLLPGFADALESSDRQLKDLRITGNINDIKDERCRDVFRKRIAKFLGEDSMLHPLRREVFRMADHVSEM